MTTETLDRSTDRAETKDRKRAEKEAMLPDFKSSISADEIVAVGSTIEFEFETAVDPQSAQSAINLRHENEPVPLSPELANSGKTVRIPLGERTGSFELTISELFGKKGERLVDQYSLAFIALDVASGVPRDARIEHAVRLNIGDKEITRLSLDQKAKAGYITALKVVSRKTGMPEEMAFDERGKKVDLAKHLTDFEKRSAERYGRIDPSLFDRISKEKPEARVPVVLWPRIELPPAPYEKPTDQRLMEPTEGERRVAEELKQARSGLADAARKAGVRFGKEAEARADDGVPCISTEATVAQIRELSRNEAVGAIYFDDQTVINDLANSINIARSSQAHLAGFDGTGIRVAVWEDGPRDTSDLDFEARFSSSPPASDHARLTSAVIKNIEPNAPHGHAPDCDLFSANRAGTDALRWAVRDQRCTVVSQSFHRNSEPRNSTLQSDDILKDFLALRFPYPTIVRRRGISGARTRTTSLRRRMSSSITRGSTRSPSATTTIRREACREIPCSGILRARTATASCRSLPPTEPAFPQWARRCPGRASQRPPRPASRQSSRTSIRCSARGPKGCRAILLAAAGRNVRGDTWWRDVINDVDGRDGAGAVDAMAGVTIARERRSRNAPASRHGWDVGTLSSAVVGANRLATFIYRVSVPPLLLAPKVKVALAWDSAVTSFLGIPLASRLTVDLDLIVRDSRGNQVASSASWDNSYEVAEFDARRGETYDIIIRRWSGTDSVWYGVAWTVRGLRIFDLPIDLETVASVA